jgi:sulfatase modifying factor 1
VLFFPIIAASLVLWTGTGPTPAYRLASFLPVAFDDGAREVDERFDSSLGAKHPGSKPSIHPKRKKRGRASGVTSHQPMRGDDAPREAITPLVALKRGATGCASDMAVIGHSYCIDIYEASLVQALPDGAEHPWPYFEVVPSDVVVRAVSLPNVYPQGYISGIQAREACARSGKRLCKPDEWRSACMGPKATVFPYGSVREVGRCNDNGRSSMRFLNPQLDSKPEHRWMWGHGGNMADPRLNQVEGTLTRTGERAGCTNEYGVFDMVGNLHEWVDDPDGTFQGGYYLDTHLNGDGCNYRTTAHPMWHLDYSTGFRCCSDVE